MHRSQAVVTRWEDASVDSVRDLFEDIMHSHAPGLIDLRMSDAKVAHRWSAMVSDPSTYVFVAWLEGAPVGMAVVCEQTVDPWSDRTAGVISLMHVRSDSRKKGIGKALLQSVVELADTMGWQDLVAHVSPNLRESQRYFARLGFGPMVTRRVASVDMLRRKLGLEHRAGLRALSNMGIARRNRRVTARVSGA